MSKMASSTSGIVYPILYDVNDDLITPLSVGTCVCVLSFGVSVGIFYLDRLSDKFDPVKMKVGEGEGRGVVKRRFSVNDFFEFDMLFWLYSIQCPIMFGAFYAFTNYL